MIPANRLHWLLILSHHLVELRRAAEHRNHIAGAQTAITGRMHIRHILVTQEDDAHIVSILDLSDGAADQCGVCGQVETRQGKRLACLLYTSVLDAQFVRARRDRREGEYTAGIGGRRKAVGRRALARNG